MVAILDGKFSNPNVKTKIITVLREILFSFSHLFLSLFLSNFLNGLMIVLLFHSLVHIAVTHSFFWTILLAA
jgi:hypothetical protein